MQPSDDHLDNQSAVSLLNQTANCEINGNRTEAFKRQINVFLVATLSHAAGCNAHSRAITRDGSPHAKTRDLHVTGQ